MGSREKDTDLQRLIPLKELGLPVVNVNGGDSRSSSPADTPPGPPSSARRSGKEVPHFVFIYLCSFLSICYVILLHAYLLNLFTFRVFIYDLMDVRFVFLNVLPYLLFDLMLIKICYVYTKGPFACINMWIKCVSLL